MLELIKEIAAVITALIVIIGAVYSVINVYNKKKEEIIRKHNDKMEYEEIKKNIDENNKNLLRLELLLLIAGDSPKQLILEIYDKYQNLHGNSYIKDMVNDYCNSK